VMPAHHCGDLAGKRQFAKRLESRLMNAPVNETARKGDVTRDTAETQIRVQVNLDGTGVADLSTGIGFFDHMLDQIVRHGLLDLTIQATVICTLMVTIRLKTSESR